VALRTCVTAGAGRTYIKTTVVGIRQSQWPSSVRHEFGRARIPLEAQMSVCAYSVCVTWRFIAASITARDWSQSWATIIKPIPSHPLSHIYILVSLMISLLLIFPPKTHAFLSSQIRATCRIHHIVPDSIILTIRSRQMSTENILERGLQSRVHVPRG
jgi:hypothetical protein